MDVANPRFHIAEGSALLWLKDLFQGIGYMLGDVFYKVDSNETGSSDKDLATWRTRQQHRQSQSCLSYFVSCILSETLFRATLFYLTITTSYDAPFQ